MRVCIYNGQNIWEHELSEAFSALGFEVKVIFPLDRQSFKAEVEAFSPQILMTLGTPIKYPVAVLEEIGDSIGDREYKYIHWDTEGPKNINITKEMMKRGRPDILLTISPEIRDEMVLNGMSSYLLPYGVNLNIHHPLEDKSQYHGILSLIASNYRPKAKDFRKQTFNTLVMPLLQKGMRVEVRGYGWQKEEELIAQGLKVYGYCNYHEINKVYNGAFANLILQNYEKAITKRTFEVLGAGGFMITYDSPAIRAKFTSGKELLISHTPEETLDIIAYYKEHTMEYLKVRENAVLRAREFDYVERLREVFDDIVKEGELRWMKEKKL